MERNPKWCSYQPLGSEYQPDVLDRMSHVNHSRVWTADTCPDSFPMYVFYLDFVMIVDVENPRVSLHWRTMFVPLY